MTAKGKFRQEQEGRMASYTVRMTAAHARVLRRSGGGILAEGVRLAAEKEALGFCEKRCGPKDRRKKR